MAITPTAVSTQMTPDFRKYPIDDHGKVRRCYFAYKNTSGAALAANSTIALCELPPGRKRIVPEMSRLQTTALGASRTLDIGHDAYEKRPSGDDGWEEAADPDAFADGLDVSTAATVKFGASVKFDMYSLGEVLVYATILGDTFPVDGEIHGFIEYIYE